MSPALRRILIECLPAAPSTYDNLSTEMWEALAWLEDPWTPPSRHALLKRYVVEAQKLLERVQSRG